MGLGDVLARCQMADLRPDLPGTAESAGLLMSDSWNTKRFCLKL